MLRMVVLAIVLACALGYTLNHRRGFVDVPSICKYLEPDGILWRLMGCGDPDAPGGGGSGAG